MFEISLLLVSRFHDQKIVTHLQKENKKWTYIAGLLFGHILINKLEQSLAHNKDHMFAKLNENENFLLIVS